MQKCTKTLLVGQVSNLSGFATFWRSEPHRGLRPSARISPYARISNGYYQHSASRNPCLTGGRRSAHGSASDFDTFAHDDDIENAGMAGAVHWTGGGVQAGGADAEAARLYAGAAGVAESS